MARQTLISRLEALEGERQARRGGVVVQLPGESPQDAANRGGPGNWLVVPAPMSIDAWELAVRQQQGEHHGKKH